MIAGGKTLRHTAAMAYVAAICRRVSVMMKRRGGIGMLE